MIIACNHCHRESGTPQAAAGIFTILPAAGLTGLLLWLLAGWAKRHQFDLSNVVAIIVALPLWLFLSWVLWELPAWITRLKYRRRTCPHCGSRDWGRPRYSGFGL